MFLTLTALRLEVASVLADTVQKVRRAQLQRHGCVCEQGYRCGQKTLQALVANIVSTVTELMSARDARHSIIVNPRLP